MKRRLLGSLLTAFLVFVLQLFAAAQAQVQVWLTSPSETARFANQRQGLQITGAPSPHKSIEIDESRTFQTIDGFGFCLTGGSAGHLRNMSPEARSALLKELFSAEGNGIGTSYLRISIGASDLDDHVYSYDDLAPGETDIDLTRFSWARTSPS